MNKIAYYAIPNPTDTASEAPALPRVIPNGVANTNDVIADITDGIAATEARCRIALEAIVAVALEHVRRGETVDLGGFRLRARIPGSMPCVDTPFDFGENTLVVDVLAEAELNEALATLVPFKVDASELASMIKVSNVTDVATMSIGEIHGTDEFIITGNGVTLDAEGESAKLVDRKTGAELATAEVVTVSKGQRATCKFNPVEGGIATGSYWLVVTTFGLIGESTPRVFRKPVTLVEAIPAGPVPIATNSDGTVKCMSVEDPESPELPVLGNDWTIGFEGLADNAKWRYDSTSFKVGGETKDSRATCDGDTLTFCGVEGVGETGEHDGVITVTLVDKDDEETTDTVEIPVRFHAEEH